MTEQGTTNAEDRMTDLLNTAPDRCIDCGSLVWADQEAELFVDTRALTNGESWLCPGTDNVHTPAL